ncbi:protein SSUH2 homolog isoform X4 [Myripristis murdjan]|uniref:protein SSUH2 homolog isoform X4 n=1 Tax=Myripristis murdjan TaxID=586833 RepID=UPI001175F492|nr:protein SSUH2 homolog isoform X4 [Myripristis murdjan]
MRSRALRRQTAATANLLPLTASSPAWSPSTPTGTGWRHLLSPGQQSGPTNLMKVRQRTSTRRPPPGPGRSRPRPPLSSPITRRRSACLSPPPSRSAITAMPVGRCLARSVMELDIVRRSSCDHAGWTIRHEPRLWSPRSRFTSCQRLWVSFSLTGSGGAALTKDCWVCHGAGSRDGEDCSRCNSTGRDSCTHCSGQGTKKCETCDGRRQLLTFIQLKVEWKNHVDDAVSQQGGAGLQAEKLSSVTGKELFKNNQYLVYPLLGFPVPEVSQASERLVGEHQARFAQSARILQQRQTVELIPITKVTYKWKGDSHVYFVLGNEHQVSADDYPATCCCVIL